MTDSVNVNVDTVSDSMKTFKDAEHALNNDKMVQKIRNRRRETDYNMSYMDWANNSIRVMASYTLMLIAILLVLVLVYLYGSTVKSFIGSKIGGGDNVSTET